MCIAYGSSLVTLTIYHFFASVILFFKTYFFYILLMHVDINCEWILSWVSSTDNKMKNKVKKRKRERAKAEKKAERTISWPLSFYVHFVFGHVQRKRSAIKATQHEHKKKRQLKKKTCEKEISVFFRCKLFFLLFFISYFSFVESFIIIFISSVDQSLVLAKASETKPKRPNRVTEHHPS